MPKRLRPWGRESNNEVSDEPGAVQPCHRGPRQRPRPPLNHFFGSQAPFGRHSCRVVATFPLRTRRVALY